MCKRQVSYDKAQHNEKTCFCIYAKKQCADQLRSKQAEQSIVQFPLLP